MTASLALVCEGPTDARAARTLVDRRLLALVDWIDKATLDDHRRYRGEHSGEDYLPWKQILKRARAKRLYPTGRWAGGIEALHVRAALLMLHGSDNRPEAVILLRDDDGTGLDVEALRDRAAEVPVPAVLGVPLPKLEAWLLQSFEPATDDQRTALEAEHRTLGEDPRDCAHTLTAVRDADKQPAKRSVKRVLDALFGDVGSALHALETCPMDRLVDRGEATGLTRFLHDVDGVIARRFDPSAR